MLLIFLLKDARDASAIRRGMDPPHGLRFGIWGKEHVLHGQR
jgi:hypothetical protein